LFSEASDLDAESDCERTKAEITTNSKQQRADLGADYLADFVEIRADAIQGYYTAEVEYARLAAATPKNVIFLVATAMADLGRAKVRGRSSLISTPIILSDRTRTPLPAKVVMEQVRSLFGVIGVAGFMTSLLTDCYC